MFLVVTMFWWITLFVFAAFFKNAECVTATQRTFRTRFGLNPNESVPDRKMILKWVQNLRTTGSTMPTITRWTSQVRENTRKYCRSKNIDRAVSVAFCSKTCLCFQEIGSNGKANFTLILNYTHTRLW